MAADSFDYAVVGGGLVGAAIAHGLCGGRHCVALLDEGDVALRASRGNFALVWVQGKGIGMPEYAAWTRRSSDAWVAFAEDLASETGIDVGFSRPGGFTLCLSDAELEVRAEQMKRLHNQVADIDCPFEILDHRQTSAMLPLIGKDVAGAVFCPHDGHVNSLRLLRALHVGFLARGGNHLPDRPVTGIEPVSGKFRLRTARGEIEAGKVVLAAGLGNRSLAPMVGLDAPVRPLKGQILVTERTLPFLRHPVVNLRQTDEGGVMIGDSHEESGTDTAVRTGVLSTMAGRALRMFPHLAALNVVRGWAALRVMSPDGFPIYQQSSDFPGAYLVTCHSGVTLAAAHALYIAPAIAAGGFGEDIAAFSGRRLDVQTAA